MERKPIKRSKHIVILSREHHSGLLFCWKIRQGLKKEIASDRIQPYVAYFWEHHLQSHFREEEELLFGKVNDVLCDKALDQHRKIRAAIQQINSYPPTPELLNQLADAVDTHIRYEERELFPHLEKVLDEQDLIRIGTALAKSHADPELDNYPDAFWVR
jgi:hemerythrin-like domain-containing protein